MKPKHASARETRMVATFKRFRLMWRTPRRGVRYPR